CAGVCHALRHVLAGPQAQQEFHLAFVTDRFDALLARHRAMGCVCFENPDMGVYFIEDPDGYWIELVPERG
ncbi:MAG: VOC family protein, partial [Flavonifractor plautii]